MSRTGNVSYKPSQTLLSHLEAISESKNKRWKVLKKEGGGFESIGLLAFIIEKIKSWFGYDRISQAVIANEFRRILQEENANWSSKNIQVISSAALRLGLTKEDLDSKHKDIAGLINEIAQRGGLAGGHSAEGDQKYRTEEAPAQQQEEVDQKYDTERERPYQVEQQEIEAEVVEVVEVVEVEQQKIEAEVVEVEVEQQEVEAEQQEVEVEVEVEEEEQKYGAEQRNEPKTETEQNRQAEQQEVEVEQQEELETEIEQKYQVERQEDIESSWLDLDTTYMDQVKFEVNRNAIIGFADLSENGQIKAFQNVESDWVLESGEGWYWSLTASNTGTQLDETVKILEKTVEKAFDELTMVRNKWNKALEEGRDKETQELATCIQHTIQMVIGLEKISQVYQKRYVQTPGKAGLEALLTLSSESSSSMKSTLEAIKKEIGSHKLSESTEITLSSAIKKQTSHRELVFDKTLIKENLEAYCRSYNSHLELEEVEKYIQIGKNLIKDILEGRRTAPPQDLDKAQEMLRDINWYFMFLALKKKQGFDEGTFMIEDSEGRLYNFLNEMPHKGGRSSSHFVGRTLPHYGVDVLNDQMPAEKRTIDYALIEMYRYGKKFLYFKPENFSPFFTTGSGYDFIAHAAEFLEAQRKKIFVPGGDDQPNMQKERVPFAVAEAFNFLLNEIEKDEVLLSRLKKEGILTDKSRAHVKKWGIAYMVDVIDKLKQLKQEHLEEISPFIKEFDSTMTKDMDHRKRRTGREVILMDNDLLGKKRILV